MSDEPNADYPGIERRIVGLYNILFEETLTREDIEFYDIEEAWFEGEIYLPEIGLNVEQWREWSTEKRVEVLIHEFAHTENYDDDHQPAFWDRVVALTDIAIDHQSEIEAVFDAELDPSELKETVVESIHEHDIEPDVDTVETRKQHVGEALGVSPTSSTTD